MVKAHLKTHYSAKELLDLSLNCLPNSVQGILYQAKKNKWQGRKRSGQGGGIEFEFSSLPLSIQAEILLKEKHVNKPEIEKVKNKKVKVQQQVLSESAWNVLASATNEQERRAEHRFDAVMKLKKLLDLRYKLTQAIDQVVASYSKSESADEVISKGSLKRWWYKVKNHPQGNWLPLLLDRVERDATQRYAEIDSEAWKMFLKDYLRKSKPQFNACYYRLTLAAEQNGWNIPSLSALKRKLSREFTAAELALARGGEHELRDMIKPQTRTIAHLDALEIVNGDGYQHNVFVDWYEDGSRPIRPKTWFWQDVRTRRILAWCVDDSENGDQIRQATLRLIKQYGIPKTILMDNTRAASDLQTSNQTKRGKHNRQIEVEGMLDRLGIKVIRTLVFKGRGNGRGKPIERAFRRDALPAYIDKDQRLEGYFTGDSVEDKPENYQCKKGANKALFLQVVEEGVRLWNSKKGRQTELGEGIYSADDLWIRDYAKIEVVKPREEQLRQLMMLGESTKVDKHGCFTLKAGYRLNGKKNTYYSPALQGGAYPYVIVRFDPDDLHGTVHVYDLNGVYLCDAQCEQPVAFDSMEGARQQRRLETQERKLVKKL
ncbi:transposase, partial [Gallibacterium salpingitidis]|uniref:transposase domain-containing protein n=1 Tax=Gallibacterium salpingitidis TaxID=505341 RepID=UPI000805AB14